jgi:hypothetical protein
LARPAATEPASGAATPEIIVAGQRAASLLLHLLDMGIHALE